MSHPADRDGAFAWVDDYVAHVRGHFEVRAEDELLIVLPNRAVKLNRSGLAVLAFLKGGGSIDEVLAAAGADPQRRRELFYFLCDFRSLLTGCLGEGRGRKAVRVVPHEHPFHRLPVLSEVALTRRCNLRCRFCYAGCGEGGPSGGGRPGRARRGEMSTRQVLRVLKVIRRDARVPSVSFTGGEPLLRDDLERLTAGAVKIGLRVNLITNGTLLAGTDRAARLASAGLSSAQVSLEGPTADVHDRLTGVAGSFERTLAGLEALRAAGVHVHTHTTVNAANADCLEGLVALVARRGLSRMSMNLIIPTGSAGDLSLQVTYRQVGAIVERVRAAARRAEVEFLWYSPTPMCLFNPLALGLGSQSCAACDGLLSVAANGDVLPCSSCGGPVGNLLRQPFREVWNSRRALLFRRKQYAPPQCAGCANFDACAGACPLYWSAMGTGELPAAGRSADAVA